MGDAEGCLGRSLAVPGGRGEHASSFPQDSFGGALGSLGCGEAENGWGWQVGGWLPGLRGGGPPVSGQGGQVWEGVSQCGSRGLWREVHMCPAAAVTGDHEPLKSVLVISLMVLEAWSPR